MIQKLKENILLAAVITASIAIITAAFFSNCGYLLKPEYRIGQSVYRLMENSGGVEATFRITSSVSGDEGDEEFDQIFRLIASSIRLEGDIAYNSSQKILSIDGNASVADQDLIPLDFYLTIDPDRKAKIKEADIREVLNRLPEIDRKKESRRLQVNRLELPVYVDSYHLKMTGKEFVDLFGANHKFLQSIPDEICEKSTLDIAIFVDKDCYCRGLNMKINYVEAEINCELAIDEINTAGNAEKISTEGSYDLMHMTRDDWLNLITESML